MVASNYDKRVRFEEGLRYDLRVLICPQREWVFTVLVDKEKIVEEVKRTHYKRRDREKDQNKTKRDSGLSASGQRIKKWTRFDRPPRVEAPAVVTGIQLCSDCGEHHPDECWRKLGAYLRCGSIEYRVRDCSRLPDPAPAVAETPTLNSVRPLRQVQ